MARPLLTAIDTRRLSTSPADLDSSDGRRSSTPPFVPLAKRGDGVTECHPLTSVGDDSPIEFEINGNGEDYIDLANTMLYVRAKVVRMNCLLYTSPSPRD